MEDFIYVYHGSNLVVPEPIVDFNEDHFNLLDFGAGFYTALDPQVARICAITRSSRYQGEPLISRYKFFQNDAIYNTEYINFSQTGQDYYDWLELVTQYRIFADDTNEYDLIEGPISDDNGYEIIVRGLVDNVDDYILTTDYLSAVDNPDQTLIDLLDDSPGEQIVFKTKYALNFLEFDGVIEHEKR